MLNKITKADAKNICSDINNFMESRGQSSRFDIRNSDEEGAYKVYAYPCQQPDSQEVILLGTIRECVSMLTGLQKALNFLYKMS